MADGPDCDSHYALSEANKPKAKFSDSSANRLLEGCNVDCFLHCETTTIPEVRTGAVGSSFTTNDSVLHWAESFDALLEDLDGVSLFRLFLEQWDAAKCLEFLFACRGFKLTVAPNDRNAIYRTVKAIYRKYLQSSSGGESTVAIDSRTKRAISERLCHKSIDRNVLDSALEQVEQHLRHRWYPRFLQSSLYQQYVESHSHSIYEPMSLWSSSTGGGGGGTAEPTDSTQKFPLPSSSSAGAPPTSATIPPLTRENLAISSPYRSHAVASYEPKSGTCESTPQQGRVSSPTHNNMFPGGQAAVAAELPGNHPSSSSLSSSRRRMTRSSSVHHYHQHQHSASPIQQQQQQATPTTTPHQQTQMNRWQFQPRHPQQPSFLPASVQESELQSLSSDPYTEDTYSHTGSSLVDSLRRLRSPGASLHLGQTFPRSKAPLQQTNPTNPTTDTMMQKEETAPVQAPAVPHPHGGKDRCLAEVDPNAFAKLLTEKLQNLLLRRNNQTPAVLNSTPHHGGLSKSRDEATAGPVSTQQPRIPSLFCQPWAGRLLAAAAKSANAKEEHQAAETILEEHCSRVWQTPPHLYPPATLNMLEDTGGPHGEALLQHQHVHLPAEHRHIHHYPRLQTQQQQQQTALSSTHMTHASDASSNIDSGVSLIYDTSSSAGPSTATALISQQSGMVHMKAQHQSGLPLQSLAQPSRMLSESGVGWMSGAGAVMMAPQSMGESSHLNTVTNNPTMSSEYSTTVATGMSKFPSTSCSSGGPGKPYPAQQKVLAWIMDSKEVQPSTTTHCNPLYYHHNFPAGPSTAANDTVDSNFSGHAMWITKSSTPRVMSGAPPAASSPYMPFMHHSHTMSKSHTFPVEEGEMSGEDRSAPVPPPLPAPTTTMSQPPVGMHFQHQTSPVLEQQGLCTLTKATGVSNKTTTTTTTPTLATVPPSNSAAPATTSTSQGLVVGYYLCDDPVPYRSHWPGVQITLAQFKQIVAKKGHFRYFFKTTSDEFDSGVVHQEVNCDQAVLPLWEGKVVAKIEKVE